MSVAEGNGGAVNAAARFLWLNAGLFATFGLGFIIAPAYFAALFTNGAPATPSGLTDMRATYGGVALGLGLLFAWHGADPARVRGGLRALGLVVAPLAAARLYGMLADGAPNAFMFAFLGAELAVVGAAVWLLRRGVAA